MDSLTRRNVLRLGGAGLAALAIGADSSRARSESTDDGQGEDTGSDSEAASFGPPE